MSNVVQFPQGSKTKVEDTKMPFSPPGNYITDNFVASLEELVGDTVHVTTMSLDDLNEMMHNMVGSAEVGSKLDFRFIDYGAEIGSLLRDNPNQIPLVEKKIQRIIKNLRNL